MTSRRTMTLALAAIAAMAASARAEVALNALFSDHAVLQRERTIPVWGTAAPGETVRVELAGKTVETTAGDDGAWRAELPPLPAGGPFELKANNAAARDVYVGEVWLASGQSNMVFTVSKTALPQFGTLNEAQEIAAANHPMIRMFNVPLEAADRPAATVDADWQVCSPETVAAFSAPAYFFARDLQQTLNVPIGIVRSAYGASSAQAWISRGALERQPKLAFLLDDYEKAKAGQDQTPPRPNARPNARRQAAREPSQNQKSPTVCYNAMIAPIEAYPVRGAIWYQGEANAGTSELYELLMQTLIEDWRSRRDGTLPFITTQLAGYRAPATQPTAESGFASVREAQRLTMRVPDTAMATAFDIGDARNIHPKNKQEVGRRLALAARATVYGEAIEWSGPQLESAARDGDTIRVTFTHAKGLAVKPGTAATPQSFAVLSDGAWRWAEATIDGEAIVVKLNPGEQPTELRYAWADNPTTANVVNADALPMLPFRAELK